jgi:L-fuculose-phosphate aldolase
MILEKERNEVIAYGIKMLESGLTTGTGGNISCFNKDKQLFAMSPSGKSYTETKPEDVVVMDLSYNTIEGDLKPSTEFAMHGIMYRKRNDISAVVHSHSPNATVLACLGWKLPPFYYLNMIAGRDVLCTPYTRFGTEHLAELALSYMENRYAVLLGNHGLLSGADSLARAFRITELVEEACGIYVKCRTHGEPNMLTDEQIDEMMLIFHKKTYI